MECMLASRFTAALCRSAYLEQGGGQPEGEQPQGRRVANLPTPPPQIESQRFVHEAVTPSNMATTTQSSSSAVSARSGVIPSANACTIWISHRRVGNNARLVHGLRRAHAGGLQVKGDIEVTCAPPVLSVLFVQAFAPGSAQGASPHASQQPYDCAGHQRHRVHKPHRRRGRRRRGMASEASNRDWHTSWAMLRTGVGVVGPCGRHGGRLAGVKAESWEGGRATVRSTRSQSMQVPDNWRASKALPVLVRQLCM